MKKQKVMLRQQPKVNKLINIYLAGAIEQAESLSWRAKWKQDIEKLGGYSVFIPGEAEDGSIVLGFKDLAETNLIEFKKKFHELIVEPDIERVNLSDLVVVRYEGEHTVGTIDEICIAFRASIPVLMVSSLPVRKINCWLLAHTTEVFPTEEELLAKLK